MVVVVCSKLYILILLLWLVVIVCYFVLLFYYLEYTVYCYVIYQLQNYYKVNNFKKNVVNFVNFPFLPVPHYIHTCTMYMYIT